MIRRLFAILALAACLPFAGCDKDEEWGQVHLEQPSVSAFPTADSYTVEIDGGSGDFLAEINNAEVADVHIEASFVSSGYALVIEPKREGVAIITVIDRKTASFALCSLTVEKYMIAYKIDGVKWVVDADSPEEIEAALKADTSVPPVGGSLLMSMGRQPSEWVFADADGKEISHGTITNMQLTDEWNPIFESLYPAGVQIHIGDNRIFTVLGDDGKQREYTWLVFYGTDTRLNFTPEPPQYYRVFEDLTDEYKAKFPDAGVRSVARVLISNGGN